jgi:hypothetical protein
MWLQEGVVGQEGGPGVPGPGIGKKMEEMDHLVLIKNKNEARVEWSISGGESRLSSPRSSFLISRFVNKCSLNITRHSSLSSSRNLTTCHTRGESKLFYFIVMFSPKFGKELDFISLNSASQIIPSVDMRVSCYKELKCRCREVREKVEGQQYTRGVENTSMTGFISSLQTLYNTSKDDILGFGSFIPGGNSSQAGSKIPTMSECISSL